MREPNQKKECEMDLRISARHFDLTPELREYAEKRILPLKKFYNHGIIDAQLVITAEKHRHIAELTFSLAGKKMFAKAQTDDPFASIDEVSHKMERLLHDYHDRLKVHKSGSR